MCLGMLPTSPMTALQPSPPEVGHNTGLLSRHRHTCTQAPSAAPDSAPFPAFLPSPPAQGLPADVVPQVSSPHFIWGPLSSWLTFPALPKPPPKPTRWLGVRLDARHHMKPPIVPHRDHTRILIRCPGSVSASMFGGSSLML